MYNSEKNSEIQSRRWRMAHEYGKETLSKEFKSDRDKGLPDSELVEAVVALANTDGGCVYLGVEDDGTATGVQRKHQDPVGLSAMIANRTVPRYRFARNWWVMASPSSKSMYPSHIVWCQLSRGESCGA